MWAHPSIRLLRRLRLGLLSFFLDILHHYPASQANHGLSLGQARPTLFARFLLLAWLGLDGFLEFDADVASFSHILFVSIGGMVSWVSLCLVCSTESMSSCE